MEVLLLKGGSPDLKKEILSAADEDGAEISMAMLGKRQSTEMCSRSSLSNPKESSTINQEEQLENTRMEMGEVREENERLKLFLSQIVKDYQFLQKKYFDFVQQDNSKISDPDSTAAASNHGVEEEPDQLVSLTLGTSSSGAVQKVQVEEIKQGGEDLSLGFDCKLYEGVCAKGSAQSHESESDNNNNQSPEKSSEEACPPSKELKNVNGGDDEVLQQPFAKKARVSVRARCDAPTMNDGCQWRKYGQKVAKGNPCPRAYYRCTVAPGCPVRKQVQRCAEDTSILITTYEGTHNHPLPVAATAMASTTSAAVSMLTSGSSISPQGMAQAIGLSSAATTPLNGLNFGHFGISSRPTQPSYLPIPSLSSTTSNPTITLDLTSSSAPHLSHLNRLIPRPYSSSATYNFSSEVATPSSWSNRFLSYGSHPYDKNSNNGSLSLIGRQTHDSPLYQSNLQKAICSASSSSQNNPLTDSIAKAITSDPNFQSAIVAAITSYVGSHGAVQNQEGANGASPGLKLGAQLNMNVCGSSYLNKSNGSSSSQH